MIQQGSSVQQEAVLDEVVVGKGCRIGKNCRLKYCVLMDGVQLGDGCVLSDCVLDSGCVLDAGCTLAHCVVGRGVRLGEFFTATGRLVHKWARRGRVRRSEPPVEDEALEALAALWQPEFALAAPSAGFSVPLTVLEEEGEGREREGSIDYGWGKSALKGCLGWRRRRGVRRRFESDEEDEGNQERDVYTQLFEYMQRLMDVAAGGGDEA